jgi:competence protein ComEA
MPPEPVDPADPVGLHRPDTPIELPARERVAGLLAELGLSPRTAVVAFAACVVGLLGWLWLRSPAPPAAEADVPLTPTATSAPPGAPGSTAGPPAGEVVLAHAAGAVQRPGLYELPPGARVADLIDAAGGATRRADLDQVNLAAPLADGTQVLVPRRGEVVAAPPTGATGATGEGQPAAPVDLNTATTVELETLPGIGPATAAAILEYRDANGPFASVDALIDVPGIGEAKLAALADLVTV